MKKTFIILLCAAMALCLLIGAVSGLSKSVDQTEERSILIRYIMKGEDEPFDVYRAKHHDGEQILVTSPVVDGYQASIPVYAATIRSDVSLNVWYEFKAPEVAYRENAVLYKADFNEATDLIEAFESHGGLIVAGTGGNNSLTIDYKAENGMLYVKDYGRVELKDTSQIFSKDRYTVSFAMMFEEFDEKSVATAFSWAYTKYNGGTSIRYGKAMRLDNSGKVYLNDATHVTSLDTGKWYTFTIYVDTVAKVNELFINGVSYGQSTMADPSLAESVIFRIFNTDSRTSYYLDNLVIYEGSPVKN